MNSRVAFLALTVLPTVVSAQSSSLFVTASTTTDPAPGLPGRDDQISVQYLANANSAFAVLFDISPGPVAFAGGELRLGLTRALVPVFTGIVPSFGQAGVILDVPRTVPFVGQPLWFQAIGIDLPSGSLTISNGESSIVRSTRNAIVERFDNPAAEGFSGTFDAAAENTLRGTVSSRTVTTRNPEFTPFGLAVVGPLDPRGARYQQLFRAEDLAATGAPELITAIRWRPFGGTVLPQTFQRFDIVARQTAVTPNFELDPFTALPRFPNSGLDLEFARNLINATTLQTVRNGSYTIDPRNVNADGYVSYDMPSPIVFDGETSLLLDFRVQGDPNALPLNGQIVRLPVQSSPRPNMRVVASGSVPGLPPITDPDRVVEGRGDNSIPDYQFELQRIESTAFTPFRQAPVAFPTYRSAHVAVVTPGNSMVRLAYRGADDASGSNPTAWDPDPSLANGRPFLQTRITLIADPATLQVPEIDTLVVPVD